MCAAYARLAVGRLQRSLAGPVGDRPVAALAHSRVGKEGLEVMIPAVGESHDDGDVHVHEERALPRREPAGDHINMLLNGASVEIRKLPA